MFSNQNAALIECAAALMHQEQIADTGEALRRAAKRLNFVPARWPKPDQVRLALLARLQLFDPGRANRILLMRKAALEAIAFFDQFQTRAVGGVVDGSATSGSAIQFECICEHPERLKERLFELNIPAQQHETRKSGATRTWFEFTAGEFDFHLRVLLPGERGFPAELSANASKLAKLVAQEEHGTSGLQWAQG